MGHRPALMEDFPARLISRSRWVPLALAWMFFSCSGGDLESTKNQNLPIGDLPVQERTFSKPGPMTAVQSSAQVIYPSAPADPHTLQITLAEPGFARLRLASDPEVQGRRVLQHVSENRIYVTSPRAAQSQELTGESSKESLRWFRLRREAFTWNRADHWQPDKADSGRLIFHQSGRPPMVAILDAPDGLPKSIGYYSAEGDLIQRLADMQWSTHGTQVLPTAFQVENSKAVLWHESNVVIRRDLRMNTDFFLPADRRAESNAPITTQQAPK
ncbi:MAG: hypothetical protein GY930_00210 [bacterium]|nr:hypothetical protein [bacterium]